MYFNISRAQNHRKDWNDMAADLAPSSSQAAAPPNSAIHEYHEISDDEMAADKVFDMGPSLLDEMDFMFRSMNAAAAASAAAADLTVEPKSPDFSSDTNKKNEITELTSKLHCRKNVVTGSATLGIFRSLFVAYIFRVSLK